MRGIGYVENSDVFLLSKTYNSIIPKKNYHIIESGMVLHSNSNNYVIATTNKFELKLPLTAKTGDEIYIFDLTGEFLKKEVILKSNGHRIMNVSDDILLDVDYFRNGVIYAGTNYGWYFLF